MRTLSDHVRPWNPDTPTADVGPNSVRGTSSEHSLTNKSISSTISFSQSVGTDICISTTSEQILDIIFHYALNKFSDSKQRLEAGRLAFLSVIAKFVAAEERVDMCLPAFPFKSANKVYKVFGVLPDKSEEIALDRLNSMCIRIEQIYKPGAQCTIISDGLVYNGKLVWRL
jgi:pyoverdine/dityrosine biosynthesis protein Dit1